MRIESILLISIIFNICLCEDSSKQVQMVNLKFSQQTQLPSQLLKNKQAVMSLQEFLQLIKLNPQKIAQIGNIYISDWPVAKSQKTTTNTVETSTISNKVPEIEQKKSNLQTNSFQSLKKSIDQDFNKLFQNNNLNSILKQIQTPTNIKQIVTQSQKPISTQKNKNSQTIQTTTKITTSGPSSSSSDTNSQSSSSILSKLIDQCVSNTNALRKKYNVPQLQINTLLNKIAQEHSNDMVRRDYFAHQNPDGQKVGDRAVRNGYTGMIGQNLVAANSISQAWDGFLTSPPHFNNEINPEWRNIGVGIATRTRDGAMLITVLFTPKDITKDVLSSVQLASNAASLSQAIMKSSPNLKTVDKQLSRYIQQYMEKPQPKPSLMDYVVNRGHYRTPMTASQHIMEYNNNWIQRAVDKKYFQPTVKIFTKFGVGIKQIGQNIDICVIYI